MFDLVQIINNHLTQLFTEAKAVSFYRHITRKIGIFRAVRFNLFGLLALLTSFIFIVNAETAAAQPPVVSPNPYISPMPNVPPYLPPQPSSFPGGIDYSAPTNYLKNSAAFRQEIARMEINVVRDGNHVLPITEVPRVQKDDVIKIRLLDEAVGGIKPDQSNWDWTLLVAFVNPNRQHDENKSVSEEIRFRATGWYKEYSVNVPYDAQPIFFLYPKPKYRAKILNLIVKKYEDVQKLGEKTIELADAYAQINAFLNELQYVLLQTQASRYGSFVSYSRPGAVYQFGSVYGNPSVVQQPATVYNYNALAEQSIERLARSFNIKLPSCWQTMNGGINYANPLNLTSVNQTAYGSVNLTLPGNLNQNVFDYAVGSDLIGRAQCIAKNVRLEDFDFSVGNLLKQGGMFAATQLRDRYPQLAYWINLAATAIDFIVRAFQKNPLRIVPTIFSAASYVPMNAGVSPANAAGANTASVKLSLFAEAPPSESGTVTAYPLVVHRWQAEPDETSIKLYAPELAEPCLHAGQNILKDLNLSADASTDAFAKNFKLALGADGKTFPLKKNIGLGGWELNLTRDDLNLLSRQQSSLEATVIGVRGFSEIKSPVFSLALPMRGNYEIKAETQNALAAGAKRIVTIRNASGDCRCLQTVTYRSASGASFVYEASAAAKNSFRYSSDGKEVSFELDATNLQPGAGALELKNYGGEISNLNLKLYPPAPEITDFKINAGDREGILTGNRLEQIQFVEINGNKALLQPGVNNANERIVAYEEKNFRQASGNISLKLLLEDNRTSQPAKTFKAGLSRPSFAADGAHEIEAAYSTDSANRRTQLELNNYPVIPVDASEFSVVLRNELTDYDFKTENLAIETRIEKGQTGAIELPSADFEVLDWKTLRVRFALDERNRKLLGGRRLQFRLKDKERGASDWYTVKQTFVRIPRIESVSCAARLNGQCGLTGDGLDYIGRISVDGSATWSPENPGTLQTSKAADGKAQMLIPFLTDKKLLQIKLRDFPQTAVPVTNYVFDK